MHRLFPTVTVSLLIVFILAASAVRIKDCGSDAKVEKDNIEITGCGNRVCVFKKGEYANLTLPFETKTGFSSLKAEVHGIINGVPLPFRLPQPEACGRSIECPEEAGSEVEYHESMLVKKIFPSISLKVRWVLRDDKNRRQVCIEFPVQLK